MTSSRGSSQPRDPTQVSHICRWILYHLSQQGSPRILKWVAYPPPGDLPNPGIELSCVAGGFIASKPTREAPLRQEQSIFGAVKMVGLEEPELISSQGHTKIATLHRVTNNNDNMKTRRKNFPQQKVQRRKQWNSVEGQRFVIVDPTPPRRWPQWGDNHSDTSQLSARRE